MCSRILYSDMAEAVTGDGGKLLPHTSHTPHSSSHRTLTVDSKKHMKQENTRLLKWQVILEDWHFFKTHHPIVVKGYVQKGVPDCLRGTVWRMMANSIELQTTHQGLYQDLLKRAPTSLDGEIVRDISRTFPKHMCFRERHGMGQRSLFNVLKAYSEHHGVVGYCQGMGFLAALFLTYMDEEASFWLLHRLITDYDMEGLYKEGLPELALHFYVLERLMSIYVPDLLEHFKSEHVEPIVYASEWFLTLFSCNFPFNTVVRVWDLFFCEGLLAVYRVALALLRRAEGDLVALSMEEIVEYLKAWPKTVTDHEGLIRDALAIDLSRERLRDTTKEYTDSPAVRAAAQRERGDFAFSKPSWLTS